MLRMVPTSSSTETRILKPKLIRQVSAPSALPFGVVCEAGFGVGAGVGEPVVVGVMSVATTAMDHTLTGRAISM